MRIVSTSFVVRCLACACGPALASLAAVPHHAMAQMPSMADPLGVSHARIGSGTSWLPDSAPMHAIHAMWGSWTVMSHGAVTAQYDHQGSRRGDDQFGLPNWWMLMAMRGVGRGQLHLHGMLSLEPATIGRRGYPLLLQTGESHRGRPLHDRQHPHDFFMEVAAIFQQALADRLGVSFYAALAGEPALGPVAYMHRPSAQNDPLAPLGHHWQDAAHITFGVLTMGLYSPFWKLEGSAFNGREPDEERWNVDLAGRSLDSWAGRLTVNPGGRLSLAAWYGFLRSPETLHPDDPVHRFGASAIHAGRGWRGGDWSSTLLWSANRSHGSVQHSALAESNLELGSRQALFGRIEYVRKSAEDLVIGGVPAETSFDIRTLVLGAVRDAGTVAGQSIGVGVRASVNFVPALLEPSYGTRTPTGIDVFLRFRPGRLAMGMPHEHHAGSAGDGARP